LQNLVPFLTKAGLYLTFAPDKAAMWVKNFAADDKLPVQD
jgi:hypothetical protein